MCARRLRPSGATGATAYAHVTCRPPSTRAARLTACHCLVRKAQPAAGKARPCLELLVNSPTALVTVPRARSTAACAVGTAPACLYIRVAAAIRSQTAQANGLQGSLPGPPGGSACLCSCLSKSVCVSVSGGLRPTGLWTAAAPTRHLTRSRAALIRACRGSRGRGLRHALAGAGAAKKMPAGQLMPAYRPLW